MKKICLFFAILLLRSSSLFSQVAISTDGSLPDNSAMLEVKSANKGFLPPRMTHAELNAILNPADGLQVYCTDCGSNGLGAMALFMAGKWYKLSVNCPTPVEPLAGTHVASVNQIVWNWNPVTGATGYKWNTANNLATAAEMGQAVTKTESDLACNTAYTRYVWAYSICGNSAPVTLFKSTSSEPLSPPTAGMPMEFQTEIMWAWDFVADATGYKWNTANNYGTAIDMGPVNSKTETGLLCNTAYTRYVWAYAACGHSASGTLSGTTIENFLSPPIAEMNIATQNEIIWNWSPEFEATGYKWNTTDNYATAVDLGNATTKTELGLSSGTMYERYVWAYNSCGYSIAGTLFQSTLEWFCGDVFTDPRDGKMYSTVDVGGTQCWFAKNLNVGTRINSTSNQTSNGTIEKYCYNNNDANCVIYGGLYQWNEMMNYTTSSNSYPSGRQGICPAGWHVPSDFEWCQMETFLDPTIWDCSTIGWQGTDLGGSMKETGISHWASPNIGATNNSGFTALPGGYRISGGGFSDLTSIGAFWSSAQGSTTNNAFGRSLYANSPQEYRTDSPKVNGHAVRCCKDF